MTNLTLGQRIAAKRNELGLSQSALGEQLNVSRQSVFKWESDAAVPEIDKLIALSRLFGVSLEWLLGVGDTPKAEVPVQPFPSPRWQKYLTIATAICASAALVISCFAFVKWNRIQQQLEEVQELAESYAQYVHPQAQILTDVSYRCIPAEDMNSAEAFLAITPHSYQEGDSAELTILLNGESEGVYPCKWNGSVYEVSFHLRPINGYQFLFRITDGNGKALSQELICTALAQMATSLEWPENYTVKWQKLAMESDSMTFTDLHLKVPLPRVFRNQTGLWSLCELILADDDGTVVTRFDLLNRSSYSAQVDFSGVDIDFTTKSVELTFPEPEVGEKLHLFLNCGLSTGHSVSYPVAIWEMHPDGLTLSTKTAP